MKKGSKIAVLVFLVAALVSIYLGKDVISRVGKNTVKEEPFYVQIKDGNLNSKGLPTLVEFSTDT